MQLRKRAERNQNFEAPDINSTQIKTYISEKQMSCFITHPDSVEFGSSFKNHLMFMYR